MKNLLKFITGILVILIVALGLYTVVMSLTFAFAFICKVLPLYQIVIGVIISCVVVFDYLLKKH